MRVIASSISHKLLLHRICLALTLFVLAASGICHSQAGSSDNQDPFQIPAASEALLGKLMKDKPAAFLANIPEKTIHSEAIKRINQSIETLNYNRFQFQSAVNFSQSSIQNNLNFNVLIFDNILGFSGATFLKQAEFNWVIFNAKTNFSYLKAMGKVYFHTAEFNGESTFYMAKFARNIYFYNVTFNKVTSFSRTIFASDVFFQESRFNSDADFVDTAFNKTANFEHSVFNGNTDFRYAVFGEQANFSHAQFNGNILFDHASLPKMMDFSNIKVKDQIDLTFASPNPYGRTKINLIHTDIGKIKLRADMFDLYFPPNTPEATIYFVYEQLLSSLDKDGLTDDYRRVSIDFSAYKYLSKGHTWLNMIDKYWWDYGFEKTRIFLWIVVLIFIFTCINNLFYDRLIQSGFEVEFSDNYFPSDITKERRILRYVYSFPHAFLYTTFLFFGGLIGFSKGSDQFKSKNYLINVYILLNMMVGIVCVFFVINMAFK